MKLILHRSRPGCERPGIRTRATGTAALALLVSLTAACGRGGGGEVAFGLPVPLGSSYGQAALEGARLAVKEINAEGGIRGRTLRLVEKDDEADPAVALRVAEELVDDPAVVAIVGHVFSGTTVAAAPQYDGRIVALATTATSPQVSKLGDWIFRVASSDDANAVQLARSARAMHDRVAILYANDSYGRGLARAFSDAMQRAGGEVAETSPYLGDTEDMTPYLRRIRDRGIRMVFIAGLADGAARIIDQAREVGLDARFIGGDGLEDLADRGAAYEGTLVGLLFHADANDAARDFDAAYQAEYGRPPSSYAAAAYDAVKLLATAAGARGFGRGDIRDYLATVGRADNTPKFAGVTGEITFDAQGDPHDKEFAVGVIRNGTIQLWREDR
jgi:branched-chain amino acid transport system substrate-binding protein